MSYPPIRPMPGTQPRARPRKVAPAVQRARGSLQPIDATYCLICDAPLQHADTYLASGLCRGCDGAVLEDVREGDARGEGA